MSHQAHVIEVKVEASSSKQNSGSNEIESDNTKILEENLPHNGKPISKEAISPRSEYVLTYSQTDKSFVGWNVNNSESIDFDEVFDYKIAPFGHTSSQTKLSDFKVSDNKIILYNYNDNR